jgi:hypothetical protein
MYDHQCIAHSLVTELLHEVVKALTVILYTLLGVGKEVLE